MLLGAIQTYNYFAPQKKWN